MVWSLSSSGIVIIIIVSRHLWLSRWSAVAAAASSGGWNNVIEMAQKIIVIGSVVNLVYVWAKNTPTFCEFSISVLHFFLSSMALQIKLNPHSTVNVCASLSFVMLISRVKISVAVVYIIQYTHPPTR